MANSRVFGKLDTSLEAFLRLFPGLFLFLALAAQLPAQVDRSALVGAVRDPSGSSIPAATVRAVQTSIHLARETVTTSEGTYILSELPVGRYTVTIDRTGFSPLRSPSQIHQAVFFASYSACYPT